MKIFVIIVTYNGLKWLDKCVGNLRNSLVPVTPIVIDNSSSDGTSEFLETNYPETIFIKSKKNLGFGKANNVGLRKAAELGFDYVFLLNQDAWINPDTIKLLIECHLQNQEYGILSPVHLNGSGKALDKNFANYMAPEITPGFMSDTFLGCQKSIYNTSYVNAAAWLISKECQERVGGFDPIFPHYGEDDDYLNRVRYHGFKIGIVPQTVIFHDRTCKEYSQLKRDLDRLIIADILKIKNTGASFRSNLLVYSKGKIDNLTSLILYRRFDEFKLQGRAFFKTMLRLKQIYRSYLTSKE